MGSKRLIRIAALVAACVAGTAFAGISWAASASSPAPKAKHRPGVECIRYDTDDTPKCIGSGPRGKPGQTGRTGKAGRNGARGHGGLTGPVGAVGAPGPIGAQGPTGAQGAQGAQGARGIQGIQGIKGPPGAFDPDGSDSGGHTVVVLGSKIGPIPFPNGPATGTELTPSVARCPISGADREAYDGGAIITTKDQNQNLTTDDVVGLESSFPGVYAGQSEVDPLPLGAHPGAVSAQAANAYEAQAVISDVKSNHNVTVQAYVVCGP